MGKKDIKTLTNGELNIYKVELTNKYEVLKKDIKKLCDEMDSLDNEYNKVVEEMNKRSKNIFK